MSKRVNTSGDDAETTWAGKLLEALGFMYAPAHALFTLRMPSVQACELLEVTVTLPWLDPSLGLGSKTDSYLILHKGKLRLRELRGLTQGHTATNGKTWIAPRASLP